MSNQKAWDFPVRKTNKKPKLVEVTVNEGLNAALLEYLAMKDEVEELQERMKLVRIPIEEALALRGEPMEIAGHTCNLVQVQRDNFNLKEARKHIRQEVLAPYISQSTFHRLDIRSKK